MPEANQVRERSRAYPGVSLDQCVDVMRRIRRAVGSSLVNRATIAQVLGTAEATIARLVAALVHFGLLERAGGDYRLTDFAKHVAEPLNDTEFQGLLATAIRMPTLYSEVITEYEPEGALPERLAAILTRNFGIAGNAAEFAAKVFVDSARYAQVIDESLRFTNQKPRQIADADLAQAVIAAEQTTTRQKPELNTAPEGCQEFRFKLSGTKFAHLVVPGELNAKDIAIIKKQIELLEIQLSDQ